MNIIETRRGRQQPPIGRKPRPGSRFAVLGPVLAIGLAQTPAVHAAEGHDAWYDGLYAGVGIANVKGSATAGGDFVESESKYSFAARLALGYEAQIAPRWRLGGELYALPQTRPLGLGDQVKQVWGVSIAPALALRPDTTLFVGLGYEQAQTNSPVSRWTRFDVDTPVLSAGLRQSLASLLNLPVTIGVRYEYAHYQKIVYAGQADRITQERLSLSADYRF